MSNYVVSARKYRPNRFDEVVGQGHVSNTLKNALKTDHLGHSFLFCGPRGVGKTTSARILAKVLNCENRTEDFEPCNSCSSCTAFNQNSSFNIYELDAASNNGVDNIRELVDQVRFPPQHGTYKVYIIDEVHMLSTGAFNAFLKTLEEPPSYAVFILATTEKHKILPTILSRCQIYDFHRVTVDDMVEHLQYICDQEGYTAEESALHTIAQKADGALRDSLSIFDRIVSYAGNNITYQTVIESLNILDYDTFFALTHSLLIQDKTSVLKQFHKINQNGFEGDQVIVGLAEHFRNLMMAKDPALHTLLEVAPDVRQKYIQQAQTAKTSFLLNALNLANDCDINYRQSKNKRLHVELTLLKICFAGSLLKNQPLLLSEEKKNTDINDAVNTTTSDDAPQQPVDSVVAKDVLHSTKSSELQNNINPKTANQLESTIEHTETEQASSLPTQDKIVEQPKENQTETSSQPIPTKKRVITPKNSGIGLHLANLDNHIEEHKQIEQPKNTSDQEEENTPKSIPVEYQEPIKNTWQTLATHFLQKGKPILSNAIQDSELQFEDNQITVHVLGDIAKQLITDHYHEIIDLLKERTKVDKCSFLIQTKEIKVETEQTYTKQEQLDYLKQKNPQIAELCVRFDLQIDYEK